MKSNKLGLWTMILNIVQCIQHYQYLSDKGTKMNTRCGSCVCLGVLGAIVLYAVCGANAYAIDSHVNTTFLFSTEAKFTSPIGELNKSYATDASTGAATYTYGFHVPPGINGFQPDVSLTYNSQAMNGQPGPIANGWSLNLSYVQRDINNTHWDTSDDQFILNLNGLSLKLVHVEGNTYRTEVNNYMRIVKTNVNTWTIHDVDGTTYTFGGEWNRIISVIPAKSAEYVGQWWLGKVTNTNGNHITYDYHKDTSSTNRGVTYLSAIQYGNGNRLRIEFDHGETGRPDQYDSMIQGIHHRRDRVLRSITMKVNNTVVRSYGFSRNLNSVGSRYLLRSITEVGSAGGKLPATRFDYHSIETQGSGVSLRVIAHGATQQWTKAAGGDWPIREIDDDADVIFDLIDLTCDGLPDAVFGDGETRKWTVYQNMRRSDSASRLQNRFGDVVDWQLADGREHKVDIRDISSDPDHPHVKSGMFDWDGDGCLDVVEIDGGTARVWRNGSREDYSGFRNSTVHALPIQMHIQQSRDTDDGDKRPNIQRAFIDMTGDGLQDLVARVPDHHNVWHVYPRRQNSANCINDCFSSGYVIELNTPHSNGWIYDFTSFSNMELGLFDVNADGLPDIVRQNGINGGSRQWWMNTGSSFIELPCQNCNWLAFPVHNESDGDARAIYQDFNGDGFPDQFWPHSTDNTIYVRLGSGKGFVGEKRWRKPLALPDSDDDLRDIDYSKSGRGEVDHDFVDINGDGSLDFVSRNGNSWSYNESVTGIRGDLLSKVTNPLGGTTTINYNPSVNYSNTHLPYNRFVVSEVTHDNGMSGVHRSLGVTQYSYSGGVHDFADKEFRGFERVRKTLPDGSVVSMRFYQDDRLKGRLRWRGIYDASGKKLLVEGWFYHANPDTALLNSYHHNAHEGAENYAPKRVFYDQYDIRYGKPTKVSYAGNGGDPDHTEYFTYAHNAANNLTVVSTHVVREGANGRKLRSEQYFYDGQGLGVVTKGNRTRTVSHTNQDSSVAVTTQASYDSAGNQVTTTDGQGNTTRTKYDAEYKTYPIEIRNALNQITTQRFDVKTGNLLAVVDANGSTTSYEYDQWGRPIKEVHPGDSATSPTVVTAYAFNGVAPESIQVAKKTDAKAYRDIISLDGFGNPIQQIASGDESNIAIDMVHDSQGRITRVSHPRSVGNATSFSDPPARTRWTGTTYDGLDRRTSIQHADGSTDRYEYNQRRVTHTDQNGHQTIYRLNKTHQVTRIQQGANSQIDTYFEFNPLDELEKIEDDTGEVFVLTRDLMGRITQVNHPDLGTWRYEYDGNSNVIRQTDARGVVTTIDYDELNRPVGQKYPTASDVLTRYDERQIGVLSSATDHAGSLSFQHDDRLRQTKATRSFISSRLPGFSADVSFGYDSKSRIVHRTTPRGLKRSIGYSTQNSVNSISGIIDDIDYALHGAISRIRHANGLEVLQYYDPSTLRLVRIVSTDIADIAIGYNKIGDVTSYSDGVINLSESYSYDDLRRLVKVYGQIDYLFAYDNQNNVVKVTVDGESLSFEYGGQDLGPHQVASLSANNFEKFEIAGSAGDGQGAVSGEGGNPGQGVPGVNDADGDGIPGIAGDGNPEHHPFDFNNPLPPLFSFYHEDGSDRIDMYKVYQWYLQAKLPISKGVYQ